MLPRKSLLQFLVIFWIFHKHALPFFQDVWTRWLFWLLALLYDFGVHFFQQQPWPPVPILAQPQECFPEKRDLWGGGYTHLTHSTILLK